jgi:hypothetical protein
MSLTKSCPVCNRREVLKAGALALLPLAIPSAKYALGDEAPMTANGGADPHPIPWLDKNGSHNQPAGPNLEPSHIYHFKGQVARCSTFTGIGTDNQGNRIAFWQSDHRLWSNAGRVLGRAHGPARHFHSHMTYPVSGTGCPRQPDPRFSPADCALWTLLGGSCSEEWSQY